MIYLAPSIVGYLVLGLYVADMTKRILEQLPPGRYVAILLAWPLCPVIFALGYLLQILGSLPAHLARHAFERSLPKQ